MNLIGFVKLYRDGFKEMKEGRLLWKIVIIKLLIMFLVVKVFFYPEAGHKAFDTTEERANYIYEQATRSTIP